MKIARDVREQRKKRESRKGKELVQMQKERDQHVHVHVLQCSCTDSSSVSPCGGQEVASSMLGNIRKQMAKWQRSQKNEKVAHLKEYNSTYEAYVKVNTKGDDFVESITCKVCGKSYMYMYVLGQASYVFQTGPSTVHA